MTPFTPNTTGIFLDVPNEVYRAAPGVSQTELKWMDPTPAHYRARKDEPPEPPTDAQKIGTAVHSVILEGKKLDEVVYLQPETYIAKDGKTKPWHNGADACKLWQERHTDRPVVDASEFADILGMAESAAKSPDVQRILKRSQREVAGFKIDPATGLMLKARADVLTLDDEQYVTIPDLKTVDFGGADEGEFYKSIWKWGYHIQAAHYLDVFEATHFVFIVVEKKKPYGISCYYIDPEFVLEGRRKRDELLEKLAACEKLGVWPAYPYGIKTISLSKWARKT